MTDYVFMIKEVYIITGPIPNGYEVLNVSLSLTASCKPRVSSRTTRFRTSWKRNSQCELWPAVVFSKTNLKHRLV